MGSLVAVIVGVLVLVGLVILEGRRQARLYGRPSGRPNLLGVGLLELQRQLQPDRQVELLLEQAKGEAMVACEDESGEKAAGVDAQAEGGTSREAGASRE